MQKKNKRQNDAGFVGQRVRRVRLSFGMTQRELASSIGVRSHATIHKYETGRERIPVNRLASIARAFGCTIADLVKAPDAPLPRPRPRPRPPRPPHLHPRARAAAKHVDLYQGLAA